MKIWSDKLHACNKQIHQDILNFCCFQQTYEPLIFNNTSSSVKSILCCPLTSKSTNIFTENSFRLFPLVIDLCIFLSWFRWDNVFTGESNMHPCSFSLHKSLIDGLELCGLLVEYCDVFISCLDSHSDGTHSLQRIHWWASDLMLNSPIYVRLRKHMRNIDKYCTFSYVYIGYICYVFMSNSQFPVFVHWNCWVKTILKIVEFIH